VGSVEVFTELAIAFHGDNIPIIYLFINDLATLSKVASRLHGPRHRHDDIREKHDVHASTHRRRRDCRRI
jgi:hypothetical protein